jgi:CRP-like cAMP-binding protein
MALSDDVERHPRSLSALVCELVAGPSPCKLKAFAPGDILEHVGGESRYFHYISSGWLCTFSTLSDGRRHISFLYQAGDLTGLADLGSEKASSSLQCLSPCTVHLIPKRSLISACLSKPDLAVDLLRWSAQMQHVLISTLAAVTCMTARHRLVWLLLMLRDRLDPRSDQQVIDLPISQSKIGDLLGLTNVYVSKQLGQLAREGLIRIRRQQIVLLSVAELTDMIDYVPSDLSCAPMVKWPSPVADRPYVQPPLSPAIHEVS